jgi:hypothetical protein
MLQQLSNSIVEVSETAPVPTVSSSYHYFDGGNITYWNGWQVYTHTDRTAKAIQILKLLQAEKLIEVNSVPRFIELVEKIAASL